MCLHTFLPPGMSMGFANKAFDIYCIIEIGNSSRILILRHYKRLHNAQFINHTARTIAEHKYFSPALRLSSFHTKQYVQHVFSLCFSASCFLCFLPHTTIFPPPCDDACDLFAFLYTICRLLFFCKFLSEKELGVVLKGVFITRRILDGIDGNIGLEML
jgi:hypothetical protein